MTGKYNNQQRGYGVFVHRGMMAWMKVCRSLYPEHHLRVERADRKRDRDVGDVLPSGLQVDMAHILTGMVLEHMRYAA